MNRRQFTQSMIGTAAAAGIGTLPIPQAQAQPATAAPFKFSVMLWTLNKVAKTLDEQLEMVAAAGYTGVELTGQNAKWTPEELKHYTSKMQSLGLTVDSMTGIAGSFADPEHLDVFLEGVHKCAAQADLVGCRQLLATSGPRKPGSSTQVAIDNLKRAAEVLEKVNKELVIEPIDRLENPPIYLVSVTEAFEICRAVASPRLKVLYDVYHEQRDGGNLLEKFTGPVPTKAVPVPPTPPNIDLLGLVHIADVPRRTEPGTGEIRFDQIYKTLAKLNYKGYIAMEFYAQEPANTAAVLKKARLEAIAAAKG